MKLYAETPGLRTRQLLSDVAVALWVLLWARIGFFVDGLVRRLAGPAQALQDSGASLARRLDDVGGEVGDLPGIGDSLQSAFGDAADAGRGLVRAAAAQQRAIGTLALVVALFVAGSAIAYVLARYLPRRIEWVREATAAGHLRVEAEDLYVFALRAMAKRPFHELRRATPDPAGAFQAGDYEPLAALELEALGLRSAAASRPRRS